MSATVTSVLTKSDYIFIMKLMYQPIDIQIHFPGPADHYEVNLHAICQNSNSWANILPPPPASKPHRLKLL